MLWMERVPALKYSPRTHLPVARLKDGSEDVDQIPRRCHPSTAQVNGSFVTNSNEARFPLKILTWSLRDNP